MNENPSAVINQELRSQIMAADEARIAALVSGDRQALENLLSDELIYVHSSGREEAKGLYIDLVTQRHYDYRSFVTVRRTLSAIDGLVFDNGDAEIDIVVNGNLRQIASRYLMVWKEENGLWKLFRFHASPIQRAEK